MSSRVQSPPRRRGGYDFLGGAQMLFAIVALMWVGEVLDIASGHRLDKLGIEPRDGDGLAGVVFSPFLHANWAHLLSNTVPLIAMGLGIALAGAVRVVKVTVIVGLVAGLGTWLVAPAGTETIGASGIVFGYATYLAARFFWTRRVFDLALGLFTMLVWGASLLASLAPTPGVSWQAHLFGAIGGVVAARALDGQARRRSPSALAHV